MANRKGNPGNLRPPFTPEEARINGRKGAARSIAARRRRKSLAEALRAMLSCPLPKDSPRYAELKARMAELGLDWDPTVQDLLNVGMLEKAASNPVAYVAIRDTIGEKPVERTRDETAPPPPITLGLLPVAAPVSAECAETAENAPVGAGRR